jgi:hypothetical protein
MRAAIVRDGDPCRHAAVEHSLPRLAICRLSIADRRPKALSHSVGTLRVGADPGQVGFDQLAVLYAAPVDGVGSRDVSAHVMDSGRTASR